MSGGRHRGKLDAGLYSLSVQTSDKRARLWVTPVRLIDAELVRPPDPRRPRPMTERRPN